MIGSSKKEAANANAGNSHNTIAVGTVINGDVLSENDFRLDGQIDGNIVCKGKIIIGQKGIIKGNTDCLSAEICGTVEGDIKASERLILKSTSNIKGNIYCPMLEIEPNATFNGSCFMGNIQDFKANITATSANK